MLSDWRGGQVDRGCIKDEVPIADTLLSKAGSIELANGSRFLRSVHLQDILPAPVRKRSRGSISRSRPKQEDIQDQEPARSGPSFARSLIVVESEGCVFDTLRERHEQAYLPAFVACFAWSVDRSFCSNLWRKLALDSKFRGQPPARILLAALRILNRHSPSVRRSALLRTLDHYLSLPTPDPFALAASPPGSPERLILDWMTMSDGIIDSESTEKCFEGAAEFLLSFKESAPKAEMLVYSSYSEASTLQQWETAGLGSCFLRLAGAERGEFSAYLRAALKNGYDGCPILVIGTTGMAWQAAQAVGARFYPILPKAEEESWDFLAREYFPAFLGGRTSLVDRDVRGFVRMILDEVDLAAEFSL